MGVGVGVGGGVGVGVGVGVREGEGVGEIGLTDTLDPGVGEEGVGIGVSVDVPGTSGETGEGWVVPSVVMPKSVLVQAVRSSTNAVKRQNSRIVFFIESILSAVPLESEEKEGTALMNIPIYQKILFKAGSAESGLLIK